jgi:hypothetical protein
MTEPMGSPPALDQLVEQYLGLESMEVTELLLDLCGARLDTRALPLLQKRLSEEQMQVATLRTHGYTRMCEKSEQLVESLQPLVAALERSDQHSRGDKS